MSEFGSTVRKLRLDRGLTLGELAEKIGSYKSYVWQIEAGQVNPPSVKLVRRYAQVFRCDARELVRLAYLDKAPLLIRDELRRLLGSGGQPPAGAARTVPLANAVNGPYPSQIEPDGRLKGALDAALVLPATAPPAVCAITMIDESMASPRPPSYPKGAVVLLGPAAEIETGRVALVVHGTRSQRSGSFRVVARLRGSEIHLETLQPAAAPALTVPLDRIVAFHPVAGVVGEAPAQGGGADQRTAASAGSRSRR